MIYAAIDTNVLVSALLNFQSNPGQVLLSVFNGETIPLVNEEILAEYRDVLARKKFRFPPRSGRYCPVQTGGMQPEYFRYF